MSGDGASGGEMRFGKRDDEQFGAFADALRATLITAPDPERSADLIPRLAGAARASLVTEPSVRLNGAGRRSRLGLIARIGVAVALIPAAFASLAVAGVKLPDAAEAPFDAVGIDLPNQGADDDDASDAGAGDSEKSKGSGAAGGKDGAKGKPPDPGAHGRENAREHGGQAHGPGGAEPATQGSGKGNKGGKGVGSEGTPPGQTNPNRGGQGKAQGVGQTGNPPPGQANKPVEPGKGSSGAGAGGSGGAAQGQSQSGSGKQP